MQENTGKDKEMQFNEKRFYAACAAMNLPEQMINIRFEDDDFIEDEDGPYVKRETYFIPYDFNIFQKDKHYKLVASFEKRLVRGLYQIADELLRQESI